MNLCARRSQLILLAAALLFLLVLPSESGTGRERSSLDLDAVDQYIERQMAADRVPGLALAITRGDEVLYLKGYGTAGNGKPMTPHTQFYIASLSKGFTALAVMQLVEEGKIGLDEPVRAYLPEFTTTDRRHSDQITVRELLNQSSGLADSGFPTYTLPQPDSLEERIESLRHAKLVSKPGTEFHYTDPNYAVLARIVEVASGKPFGEYLRDRVFSPLEMGHTTSVLTSGEAPRAAPDLAQGHVLAFGVPIPHGEMDGFLGGSGGVISSAHDMANYLVMQNSGGQFGDADVVSQKSVSLMHTPPRGIDSSYAMGWTVPTGANPRVIEHDGVLSAFRADAALLPDEGYGVVLLYDQSYALADYAGTRQGLLDLLVSKRPDNGGLGAGKVGVILAAFALVTTALQVRGLLRLRGWAARVGGRLFWRLVPGIVWKFVPAAMLVALQPLVAFFAGRVFSYPQLFWAMPDVVSWLILGAVLGGVAGAARIVIVARRSVSAKTLKEAKVYRKSGIKRFMKAGWFRKATTEAAGPDATRRGIAAERWEELQEFRATHPLKRITVEEMSWDYIASGEGDEALLLLPGGAMVGESHFTRIPAFENRYRVIAPSYASVSTAAELLDGLAGVLDAEGVLMAHVLGPSYGGLVAQCFVRRHPGRVKTLILANTLVPPRSLLWPSKIFLTLLPFIPVGWLRTFRERTLVRAFSGVPSVPQEDQVFWRDYQHGLISRLSKAELRDMYRLGVDLIQSFRFEPDDVASWPGRVLILESDEDILTLERRTELRRCYPQARVHTFHGAGHTPWMSHREEYLSVIKEFLDQ